jgi:predicted deacylase
VRFSIGETVEGQNIWAWQFGQGEQRLVLVGGIHGGYEANSTLLTEMLVDHFRDHAEAIIPGIQLTIIPAANPDGLTHGSDLDARFNTNGVDLNRNWGCAWEPIAYLRDIEVSPGPRPFSEPETQALRTFFIVQQPAAVVFYHSSIGAIYMGACGDHPAADWMGNLLAEATGYPYQASFDYYEVSGDATDWLAERGIPAATVELYTRDSPEFDRNLRGVQALQCALVEEDPVATTSPIYEQLCQ